MAEDTGPGPLPQATVVRRKRTRISIIWIIPLLAAVVAAGIAIQRIRSQGPTIAIAFKSASGVEAGKTFIKYKDVRIGLVTAVELSADYSTVIVKAKIAKHAGGLMVDDAKFWIVEPRISLSGISGLNTLLSGNYIGFDMGQSTEERSDFVGLDKPPVLTDLTGRQFVLKAARLGSLNVGSPVYYRQINVGQVTSYQLAEDGKSVAISVFVDAPYDKFVTASSRFWNASGIDVSFNADGIDVRTESLVTVLAGGIAFDSPERGASTAPAAANAAFTLFRNRVVAMKQPDPVARRFALHFRESVRGLSVGAPVTLYGLRVGEVAEVGLALDPATDTFQPRVLISFFPEHVADLLSQRQRAAAGKAIAEMTPEARMRLLRKVVEERGLRAQLRTGSLLTGELYVAFEYFPNAPKARIDWSRDPTELPVVPGVLSDIEAKLGSILGKIDGMPLDAIGKELRNSLASLDKALKDANVLVNHVDAQWVPEGTRVLEDLRRTIGDADRVINNTDATLFGKDSPAPQDVRDAIQEVTRAARAIRVLVDFMQRHPEMLIRGKSGEKP